MAHQKKLAGFRHPAEPSGARRCWNCSEPVKPAAAECPHCGEVLDDA